MTPVMMMSSNKSEPKLNCHQSPPAPAVPLHDKITTPT